MAANMEDIEVFDMDFEVEEEDEQDDVPAPNPAPVLAAVRAAPIDRVNARRRVPRRAPRPRQRPTYSQQDRERAVRLLNGGMPCRQVARMIGPHCSSGTPIRWRKQMRAAQVGRDMLANQIRAVRAPRFAGFGIGIGGTGIAPFRGVGQGPPAADD